ncbi:MAG: hypothetical protein GW833_05495, partial [Desulfuromonadales bacterium]|nr:hypothetical protein [Desulfuromonadales bacterium]
MSNPVNSERSWLKSSALWLLLVLIVAGSTGVLGLFLGIGLSAVSGSSTESGLKEVLVDGEKDSEKKIAAIPIKGVIMESMGTGPGTVSQVKSALKAIKADESVVGILLVIDTPGGGVTASDRIYHDLLEFKKEKEIPIH